MCSIHVHLAILQECTVPANTHFALPLSSFISLTECNTGKTQKLSVGVHIMIWFKNTGTILGQNTPRKMPELPEVVIFLSSISVRVKVKVTLKQATKAKGGIGV